MFTEVLLLGDRLKIRPTAFAEDAYYVLLPSRYGHDQFTPFPPGASSLSVSEPNCFWSSTSSLKLKYSYFERGNRFQKLELQIHGTQPRVKKDFNLFPKPKPKPPHGGAQSLCFAGKQSQNCFTINIKSFIFKYQ